MWERVILHKLGAGRHCERVHLYSTAVYDKVDSHLGLACLVVLAFLCVLAHTLIP